MKAISNDEISKYLTSHLKNWNFAENAIKREFKFKTFVEAFSFMTATALEAEKMDHHPDWSNGYNKVNVALSTHSAGGVSQQDFDLAEKMDGIFKTFGSKGAP